MLRRLEWVIKSDYVLLLGASENVELLHDLALAGFFIHELLVDRFQSHKFARKPVDRQIYLAKSSLAHNFTNFVVLNWGLGRTAGFYEVELNVFLDFVIDARPRRQFCICNIGLLGLYPFFNHIQWLINRCIRLFRFRSFFRFLVFWFFDIRGLTLLNRMSLCLSFLGFTDNTCFIRSSCGWLLCLWFYNAHSVTVSNQITRPDTVTNKGLSVDERLYLWIMILNYLLRICRGLSGGFVLDFDLDNLHVAFFGFGSRVNYSFAVRFAGLRLAWNWVEIVAKVETMALLWPRGASLAAFGIAQQTRHKLTFYKIDGGKAERFRL